MVSSVSATNGDTICGAPYGKVVPDGFGGRAVDCGTREFTGASQENRLSSGQEDVHTVTRIVESDQKMQLTVSTLLSVCRPRGLIGS